MNSEVKRMIRVRWWRMLAGALGAAAVALGSSGAAAAQVSAPPSMVVELRQPDDSLLTLADLTVGEVTVMSAQAICATQRIEEGQSAVVLSVGGPNQPPQCSLAGATLTLVNGADQELFERVVFAAGSSIVYINFAPVPPDGGRSSESYYDPIPASEGVQLTRWLGGTIGDATEQLTGIRSIWATRGGQFIGYIPGAPVAVNAPFREVFPYDIIPVGTALLVFISD